MDWREEYRELGFIIVENALSHALIEGHLEETTALLRQYGAFDSATNAALPMAVDDELMVAMRYLHQRGEITRRLLSSRIISSILGQLFDAKPVLGFGRSALWQTDAMRAHVDTCFRSPDPPYSICRTWCALEDIHQDSGRFYLVPGAHRSLTPRLCAEVLDERADLLALFERLPDSPELWRRLHNQAWPLVSAKVAERIAPDERIALELKKGDVVFFNPAVAHGAFACADPSFTRKMMLCEWTAPRASGFERCETPALRREHVRAISARRDNLIDIRPILAVRAASR
jgi:hypothetical protein